VHPLSFYDRAIARLTRRELLNAAWALGAAAVLRPVVSTRVRAAPSFKDDPFSLGVASGDPQPDGVVLWTRLAPDPLNADAIGTSPVEVSWEVSDSETFRTIVQTGTSMAYYELGHAVHAEVPGLQPGRDYWYRFHAGDATSPIGRTRTAPAPGARVDALRFVVCGCSNYEAGYFTALRHIAEEHADFVFHTGDFIYETGDGRGNKKNIRYHLGDDCHTLTDYRNRYAQYRTDPDLRAAQESAPFIVTWDDHEVTDDYAGSHDTDGTPPEVFLLRRAAAYQAYYEAMPLRRAQWPGADGMRLYRRLVFGDLIDLSVLDTRQYRSQQACGDGFKPRCADALDPGRTMLGDAQERWLFDTLASSRARWTVLGQQVIMFPRRSPTRRGAIGFGMDKWDGYPADRLRVLRRLQQSRALNPVVLSGDIHVHYAADLHVEPDDERSPVVASELTNTSISTNGDGSDVGFNWDRVREENPHIRYHSARRGYISVRATPAEMRADFKTVERITVPNMPIRTSGTVVIEAGKRGLVT
jgi:alkaline phosphatase D